MKKDFRVDRIGVRPDRDGQKLQEELSKWGTSIEMGMQHNVCGIA